MPCAACGFANAEAARFCGSCGSPLAATCPRCHEPVPAGVHFCTSCGESLAAATIPEAAGQPEGSIAERRRVSVLFVDLVEFTALAESLDPEEVRTLQARYFEVARSTVASHGGIIEKFIGDAVMAVWGAPAAHEDDADRAVRAALAIVDGVRRLGGAASGRTLSARGAVMSGEAAVTLGAIGQGMVAGDLINTAARLQAQSPPGGILVDLATRELAADAAEYEPVGPLSFRGREAPLQAYRATARTRPWPGRQRGSHAGPFVGRDRELRELLDLFDSVVRDRRSRLVSITGIAGMGKSRLAWELAERLEALPDIVLWHAGRAPAYGDEITFAAVAEMVLRRVRIPEDAPPELARRQLTSALTEIVRDDEERRWMEPRVAVLLERGGLAAFDRDELFAAWRRFFERVSDSAPTVMVFEDLQWADAGLLDFVEHLAAWTRGHPILIVTLARPELLDRRPAWGAGLGSFTALHLERLGDEAMRELLNSRAPGLADAPMRKILEHAGGVPLYAVEVARILADNGADGALSGTDDERRAMPRAGGAQRVSPIDVPDSLHGVIAARIDALPAPERSLLLAAGVLGRRFRPEALAAVAVGEPAAVGERIENLVRRELLATDVDLSSPGRGELAFVQDLVREVAYHTLSRSERRRLHLAAARYLETKPDDDVAESLAGHLVEAHGLAPDHPDAHRLARRAVAALRRAAQNSLRLHVAERAVGHLEQALRLTDTPEQRALVLGEAAAAARWAARLDLAEAHLRELVAFHRAAMRRHETTRARAQLASVLLMAQHNEPAIAELEAALRASRDFGADDAGVELASQLARARMLVGDDEAGLDWAQRALAAAERLGLKATATDILVTRGTARFRLGEEEAGLDDLRRAIAQAEAEGYLTTELRARNNLAWLLVADDPRTTLETAREAVELATKMGVGDIAVQLAEVATAVAVDTGDWDWALATVAELEGGAMPDANRINLAATVATIRALRGDPEPMAAIEAMEPFPAETDVQVVASVHHARAWAAFVGGNHETARQLAERAAAGSFGAERMEQRSLAIRSSLWLGDRDAAMAAFESLTAAPISGRASEAEIMTLSAGIAALDGEGDARARYRAASQAWRQLDLPLHLALCELDAYRLLPENEPSDEALGIIERLGADGLRRLIGRGAARPRARSRPPTADTARRKGGARRKPPARGRPSPSG